MASKTRPSDRAEKCWPAIRLAARSQGMSPRLARNPRAPLLWERLIVVEVAGGPVSFDPFLTSRWHWLFLPAALHTCLLRHGLASVAVLG